MQHAPSPVAELIAETLLLHWPAAWVGKTMCRFPRRCHSKFATFVRLSGKVVKQYRFPLTDIARPFHELRECLERIANVIDC